MTSAKLKHRVKLQGWAARIQDCRSSGQSATRIFRELEYSGLIIRKKQGLGKPALITLNYPSDAKLIAKEGEDAQA